MPRKKQQPKPPTATNLDDANAIIQVLWDRLNDLEDRLNQNSRNSSRPPSSNGPGTSTPTRKSTGKSRGAQTGHKGSKRVMSDSVDESRVYYPDEQCPCGGHVVMSKRPYRRHQVFEIPQQAYSVVEHQLYQGCCYRCSKTVKAPLPETVNSGQMGNNLLAYVVVQAGQFHQSISKIQQQLIQNFGLHFSRGAISQAQGTVSSVLTPAYEDVKNRTLASDIVHCDETRHQRGRERRWMWQVCTQDYSCFMTHYSRGNWAAKKLLGESPTNMVVTDQYAGYHYIDDSHRQLCWAHILRNMQALADSWGTNKLCGAKLVRLIHLLFRLRHRFDKQCLSESSYLRRIITLQEHWQQALHEAQRLCTTRRYRNRCALLLKHDVMCWAFVNDHRIPLTNNEAERSLRSYVLWRKGSYGVWSHRGEQFRQRILSIVETCRKQSLNPLQWIRSILNAVLQKQPYPLLADMKTPCQ
ncbi:IS66 family transposase [Alteromonas pelagimontana]|uniref:IS66 family transposase n=1 Tax=Alteromonas pelagimontana TaxID=1858656 RepID=A0A6M4MBI9_9ALTE|nr:IS66 family transposase [Alteromonas pelagimontana]QJR80389.1 IS66 family transposase [Alteromonas pelagimontana]